MSYFEIGKIVNTHGIQGEIRVLPSTDDPSRFGLLDTLEIFFTDAQEQSYPLEKARLHKNLAILKLKGIDTRNAAENLVGGIIKIPPEKALPLEEGEYYQRDLLGMTVVTGDGEELGELAQILVTGANDVYVVRPLLAEDNKKDILIPAIRQCILDVSVAEKLMTVNLMDGLR